MYKLLHVLYIIQVRGAHVFWEEFLSRLSQGAAVAGGGAVSHTRNQLEAAVRAKRSIEAIELIPEVHIHYMCCWIFERRKAKYFATESHNNFVNFINF